MSQETLLKLENVSHRYESKEILKGLSFELKRGAIGCLLGPSGSGKTTALRVIAGFEPILSGEVKLRGQMVSDPDYVEPPNQRKVGVVFQDYALFPHLNVRKNIEFGLPEGVSEKNNERVDEMAQLLNIQELLQSYPHQISGGQQQRVAIARALAPQPDLIVFDEPFSNLDFQLREELIVEFRSLLKDQNMTALFVTHSQEEAFSIGDLIGVMHEGRLQQWASPMELYHYPLTPFVAEFLGKGQFIPARMQSQGQVQTELGSFAVSTSAELKPDKEYKLFLRPENLIIDGESCFRVKVQRSSFLGYQQLLTLETENGVQVLTYAPAEKNIQKGDHLCVSLKLENPILF